MKELKSLSNFEYHCLKGLSENGKIYAKDKIRCFKDMGLAIPYGIIHKISLNIK